MCVCLVVFGKKAAITTEGSHAVESPKASGVVTREALLVKRVLVYGARTKIGSRLSNR